MVNRLLAEFSLKKHQGKNVFDFSTFLEFKPANSFEIRAPEKMKSYWRVGDGENQVIKIFYWMVVTLQTL